MQTTLAKKNRLEAVDVLRGIAALSVVIFHYSGHSQKFFVDFPFSFEYGKYGVQLFFVISGFFIYSTLEKCDSATEFLLLRCSRLYPAYWATLITLIGVDAYQGQTSIWYGGYMVNATMLQSFIGFPDIDIVFWSLAVEMTFYLLMALLLATGAIRTPFVVSLIWLIVANFWPSIQQSELMKSHVVQSVSSILTHGPFFIGGMMFYSIKKSEGRLLVKPLGIIILCIVTAYTTTGPTIAIVALVSFTLMGLTLLGKLQWLVNPGTLWLGAISYSLYLVHRNLGYAALFKLNELGVNSSVAFALVCISALTLASAFTYWIEQPSLRYFRRQIRTI